MSSSFYNEVSDIDVSNRMFWTVIQFALEIAEKKESPNISAINKMKHLEEEYGYTPDVNIEEEFEEQELEFWSQTFNELAHQIYRGDIGNQENQEWQVWTIWAACSFSRLFNISARRVRNKKNDTP